MTGVQTCALPISSGDETLHPVLDTAVDAEVSVSSSPFKEKAKVKSPSFTSVTRNNHPPNVYRVPEFSSPLSNACQSSVHQQGKK